MDNTGCFCRDQALMIDDIQDRNYALTAGDIGSTKFINKAMAFAVWLPEAYCCVSDW
jgi:hypothetical protein